MQPFDDLTIAQLTSWLEGDDDFVFLESSRLTKNNCHSYLFRRPHTYLVCHAGDNPQHFLAEIDAWRAQGFFLSGWLAYEFGYLLEPCLYEYLCDEKIQGKPLAMLGVFEHPTVFDHTNSLEAAEILCDLLPAKAAYTEDFICTQLTPALSKEQYLQAIAQIQKYIGR